MSRVPRLIAAVTIAALASVACADEPPEPTEPDQPAELIRRRIETQDFRFVPANVQIPLGQPVQLNLENTGDRRHAFVLAEGGVDAEVDGGTSAVVAFGPFDQAGVFPFFCKFHAEEMTGELFVGTPDDLDPAQSTPLPTVGNTSEGDTEGTSEEDAGSD